MGLITQEERHELVVEKWNRGDRRGRRGDGGALRRPEPHLHDGQLGCARLDVKQIRQLAGHARPDGQPEGRDHRAPDQGQLHGRPDRPRVLHLDPRRPQGPRRHGAAYRRLRLPDAPSRRRRPGRDHPRGRLRHQGRHRAAAAQRRRASRTPNLLGRIAAGDADDQARPQDRRGGRRDRPRRARRPRSSPRTSSHRRPRSPSARCSSAPPRPACARPATAARWRPATPPRSATRSASSPRSRSASRARS